MTASEKMQTPSMTLPLKVNDKEFAKAAARNFYRLVLPELIDGIEISESLAFHEGLYARVYNIILNLKGPKEFSEKVKLTSKQLRTALQERFLPALVSGWFFQLSSNLSKP
jgi:hypothetical protein